MTDPRKLTTDPPRPPGTPDVDDLVGEPVPAGEQSDEPHNEDVTSENVNSEDVDSQDVDSQDTVSVEPPD